MESESPGAARGRVDRFGQQKPEVRAVVLFSEDNPIDGVVLNVLIRKARQIYQDLGISVPVPTESESVVKAVVKAVFEGWRGDDAQQLRLDLPEMNTVQAFHENWKRNADREERRRSRFAQHTINPDEVAKEIEATDTVLGDPEAVRHFMVNAAQRLKFSLQKHDSYYELDPAALPAEIRDRLGWRKPVKVVFVSPPPIHRPPIYHLRFLFAMGRARRHRAKISSWIGLDRKRQKGKLAGVYSTRDQFCTTLKR